MQIVCSKPICTAWLKGKPSNSPLKEQKLTAQPSASNQMLTAKQFPTAKAAREGQVAEEPRARLEKWSWALTPLPPSPLPFFPRSLLPSLARSCSRSLSLSLVNRYIEIYCIRVDPWQAGGGSVKGKGRICILDTQKNICALNNVLESLSDFVAQRLFLLPALSLLISFLDAFCLFAEFAVTKKRCQEKGITRNKCLKKRAC